MIRPRQSGGGARGGGAHPRGGAEIPSTALLPRDATSRRRSPRPGAGYRFAADALIRVGLMSRVRRDHFATRADHRGGEPHRHDGARRNRVAFEFHCNTLTDATESARYDGSMSDASTATGSQRAGHTRQLDALRRLRSTLAHLHVYQWQSDGCREPRPRRRRSS